MAECWTVLEDMEDVEDFADLEADSVVDLMVPVADEMLDTKLAGIPGLHGVVAGSGAVPPPGMETRAPHRSRLTHSVGSLPQ